MTKDYPDDQSSRLDRPHAWRVNISAGSADFLKWAGRNPREPAIHDIDPSTADVVIPHPVYGSQGWLSVVIPGPDTTTAIKDLLRTAHHLARARHQRRSESKSR